MTWKQVLPFLGFFGLVYSVPNRVLRCVCVLLYMLTSIFRWQTAFPSVIMTDWNFQSWVLNLRLRDLARNPSPLVTCWRLSIPVLRQGEAFGTHPSRPLNPHKPDTSPLQSHLLSRRIPRGRERQTRCIRSVLIVFPDFCLCERPLMPEGQQSSSNSLFFSFNWDRL